MDKRLTAHPAFAAMEKRQASGSLTVVQGFVGSSSDNSVRIYPFLSRDRFIEIPKADIVHVDDIANSGGMVQVFIDDAAEVTVTFTRTRVAKAKDVRRAFPLENLGATRFAAMARQKDKPVLTNDEILTCIFDCWIKHRDDEGPHQFLKQLRCESACFEREGNDLFGF